MTAPKTTAIALGPTLRAGRVGSVGLVVTGGILAIALVLAGFGSLLAPDALVQDIQEILGPKRLDMLPMILKLIFLEGGGVTAE